MKFHFAMTAGLAGYILKNKMRPRPEWQKNAAGGAGVYQSVSHPAAQGRGETPAASHDWEALSASC